MTQPLLVGEAPNRAGQGKRPNTTFTGGRLATLGAREMRRTNLLREWPGPQGKGSAFPLELARPAARRLLRRTRKDVPLVLVGTRVAAAFGISRSSYEYLEWFELGGRRVAVIPHPSGINMWWNDQGNCLRAARFFRDLLREAFDGDEPG